ncbi:MAG: 1-acyl-sn-glycerol-3-phosphate acyltransferase [Oscillospiraceae bacterium]|nr:1-acyl-sn-glycerol-3-phosphate acyltransferase [Oscillospiraceae bacterium]
MKTRVLERSYREVQAIEPAPRQKPLRPHMVFRSLIRALSAPDLLSVKFQFEKKGMERLGEDEPCLFLMNHSSFIDLKLAYGMLYPRPFNIVSTADSYIGKDWLMRLIGCIPTKKFVSDPALVRDMVYCLKTLKSSVLMFPEAGYSFDGTAALLPDALGKCVKLLGVPVVMLRSYGAFARDPLYNGLQNRKVPVRATMEYVLSPEELGRMSADEINGRLRELFTFDNFRWQRETGLRITEGFRADGLHRLLYKCPHCLTEGEMEGKGTELRCRHCGRGYELTELGELKALTGHSAFDHVPDWYNWQRNCVRAELESGSYALRVPVEIHMLVDTRCFYKVGEGWLFHDVDGFYLTGCDGELEYWQGPAASYSLNADYYYYEIGDMISIGDQKALYYCYPQENISVTKVRLAAEELYKMKKRK